MLMKVWVVIGMESFKGKKLSFFRRSRTDSPRDSVETLRIRLQNEGEEGGPACVAVAVHLAMACEIHTTPYFQHFLLHFRCFFVASLLPCFTYSSVEGLDLLGSVQIFYSFYFSVYVSVVITVILFPYAGILS